MSRRSLFPAPVPPVSKSEFAGFRAPKFYSFLGLILLALVVASAWRTVDSSLVLMNLKAGERIVELKQVPQRDFFSATSDTRVWSYPEWGWGVFLALVNDINGLEWVGLTALSLGCVALTACLMLWRGRRRGARWFETIVVSGVALGAMMPTFQATPDRLAHVLFLLALLSGEARRLRFFAMVPLITVLWANVHPAFLLPGAIAFFRLLIPPPDDLGGPEKGPNGYLFVICISCIAAALVNPRSLQIAQVPYEALVQARPDVRVLLEGTFLLRLGVSLGLMGLIASGRRIMYGWEWLMAGVLLVSTVISPAMVDFLLIYLAAPAAVRLTGMLSQTWAVARVRHPASMALCLCVVAVMMCAMAVGRLTTDAFGAGLRKDVFPEMAAGRLASMPIRNSILNLSPDGGYLAWRTWPAWQITMDDRPRLYSPEQREQFDVLWRGGVGWEKLLTQWRVNAVLGSPEIAFEHPEHNLYYRLAESRDWVPVHWDRLSILYVQQSISLRDSNLAAFRELKPGLPWGVMTARLSTEKQWRDLAADLRRVLGDDPGNMVAMEFLRMAEERLAEGW